jgi:hypothetical protein
MNYRIITRRAHKVVIPFRRDDAFISVHTELFEAFQRDQINRDVAEMLAAELDRDLREQG